MTYLSPQYESQWLYTPFPKFNELLLTGSLLQQIPHVYALKKNVWVLCLYVDDQSPNYVFAFVSQNPEIVPNQAGDRYIKRGYPHLWGLETSNWCCWLAVKPSVWETLISERKQNRNLVGFTCRHVTQFLRLHNNTSVMLIHQHNKIFNHMFIFFIFYVRF